MEKLGNKINQDIVSRVWCPLELQSIDSCNLNILQGILTLLVTDFNKANHVLEGVFKDLTVKGLDNPKPHCPLEPGDFRRLIESGTIGLDNPVSLQNLVFLNLSIQLGKRGNEGWRQMKKDTLLEAIDDQGKQYLSFKANQKEKKYSGGTIASSHRPEARVYEQEGVELCPVRAYKLYKSYLSPTLDDLWQRPNKYFYRSGVWYAAQPLGQNTLATMMKAMSKSANLSLMHTNHCLRATSSTILAEAGVQDRDIAHVTGHKDVKSLKRYIDRAPSSTKRLHSDILYSAVQGKAVVKSVNDDIAPVAGPSRAAVVTTSSATVPAAAVTTSASAMEIIDMDSSCELQLSDACEEAEINDAKRQIFENIPMNFKNCKVNFENVTFNFNMKK